MAGTLHFSSVFGAESSAMGLCLTVATVVLKPSRFNVSLFSPLFLIVSTYSDRLLKRYSLDCDASSIVWADFFVFGAFSRDLKLLV